jgi:hypothetical protein
MRVLNFIKETLLDVSIGGYLFFKMSNYLLSNISFQKIWGAIGSIRDLFSRFDRA